MTNKFLKIAADVINQEADALKLLAKSLDENFSLAISLLKDCKGRIIVSGMGKSGHIAKKIVAILSSTGSPALFIHPAEANHGDLGMITKQDVVIAISKSGESPELTGILQYCKRNTIKIIGITSKSNSSLANISNIKLLIPNIKEACNFGLAPTTSAILTLALGDAIAISLSIANKFTPIAFQQLHPGGKLGQKLMKVEEVMSHEIPIIEATKSLKDTILIMNEGRLGCAGIINSKGDLIGIFTDGDLRRNINIQKMEVKINKIMTKYPMMISPNQHVEDLIVMMKEKRIPSIFVCEENKPVGVVHIHNLIQKGFI